MSLLNENLNKVENFNPKDQLFKTEDKDLWMSANLNILGKEEKFYLYATGYLEAAKIIYKNLDSQGRYHDILVYPIIYLFRQSIELLMKDIILKGNKIIQKLIPNHNENDIKILTSLIKEFDKIDSTSQEFRYPEKNDGIESLHGISYINLEAFYKTASKVCDYLIGIDSLISEQLDNLRR